MTKNTKEQRRREREHEAHTVVHDVQIDRRRTDNRTWLIALAAVAVVAIGLQVLFTVTGGFRPQPAAQTAEPGASEPAAGVPDPAIAEGREWTGTISLNGGDVQLGVTIDGAKAPQAAANFIDLSQKDFFDNTDCHRLTTEGLFVLQCGDPTATGTGGPGYEFGPLENIPADNVYPAGTIAMARAQAEDSMGSQFFIVYEDTQLPAPGYTVFGQVTSGLDDLKGKIVDAGVDPAGGMPGDGKPLAPAQITDVTLQ